MKQSAFGTSGQRPVLYFEYARMLVTVNAVFLGLACLLSAETPAMIAVGVVASAWVAMRAARAMKWHWYFLPVTLILLALMFSVAGQQAEGMTLTSHGPFSSRIIIVALALIGCVDFTQMAVSLHGLLLRPDNREWIHDLLIRHGLRLLLWGTFGFVLAYSLIVPLYEETTWLLSSASRDLNSELDRMSLLQNTLFRFCEAMSGMWFFVVGCCVGSFLNVVIYRVPLRISVLTKASHCPQCSEKILGRDNLPLIGWLKLQGRCRHCGTAISPRYPLVELTTGLLFLLLYFVELISGGTNLPGRPPNMYAGALWILFYTKWDLVGLYAFHCFVLCALLCWTMIQFDEKRVPARAVVTTLVLVAGAVLVWPHLLPFVSDMRLRPHGTSPTWTQRAAVFAPLISGSIAGLLAGVAVRRLFRIPQHPVCWMLAGMALGWQAVVVIGLLSGAAKLILVLLEMLHDSDSVNVLPAGSVEVSEPAKGTSCPPSAAGGMSATAAAVYWGLFPMVLLAHHCLWRQLAFFSAAAM